MRSKYHETLSDWMGEIGKLDNSIFLGQQVADYAGSF
jgi:hypothetical protein